MQSQSPAEIDRMIRYHGYFSAQRIELVEQYSATLSSLEDAEQTLVEQRQSQQQQIDALREQQSRLDKNKQQRKTSIANLQNKASIKKPCERGCWQIASDYSNCCNNFAAAGRTRRHRVAAARVAHSPARQATQRLRQ